MRKVGGGTTVDGCGLQEGGWGADSSDRTLFICRVKCQHSTPETSTQSSGVCTLTLTAEMRSVCSKIHPSIQRRLSGTSQFPSSVRSPSPLLGKRPTYIINKLHLNLININLQQGAFCVVGNECRKLTVAPLCKLCFFFFLFRMCWKQPCFVVNANM